MRKIVFLSFALERKIDFTIKGNIKNKEDFLRALKEKKITYIYGPRIDLEKLRIYGKNMKPEDEKHAYYLLSLLQKRPSGKERLEEVHKCLPGYGYIYKIIYE